MQNGLKENTKILFLMGMSYQAYSLETATALTVQENLYVNFIHKWVLKHQWDHSMD